MFFGFLTLSLLDVLIEELLDGLIESLLVVLLDLVQSGFGLLTIGFEYVVGSNVGMTYEFDVGFGLDEYLIEVRGIFRLLEGYFFVFVSGLLGLEIGVEHFGALDLGRVAVVGVNEVLLRGVVVDLLSAGGL